MGTATVSDGEDEGLSKKFKTSTGAAITMPTQTSKSNDASASRGKRKTKRVDSKVDKNTRERKRRKNIKARFDKLHELMVSRSYVISDPTHMPPSKVSVLNSAISTLSKMTKEIEELRKENSKLEGLSKTR